ncbi:MAG TPA: hypothetical protein VF530_20410 [Planctomycetota bacterium]
MFQLHRFLQRFAVLALLAAPALAQRDSPFMEEFKKLMAVHADDEMAKLVKKNEEAALAAVRDCAIGIRDGSNDALENEIDALGKAWRKAYDSQFVSIQYDFFAIRLTGPYKRNHADLVKRYSLKRNEYIAVREKKETASLPALGLEFEGFGKAFGELGDDYLSSECFRAYAECFDETLAGATADLKRACEGWGQCLAAREKVDLKDTVYAYAKARFDKLEFDGYGDPSKGPAARAAAKAEADVAYKPKPIGATFQLVADLESIQRPLYTADTNFQIWPSIALGAVDSTAKIPTLEDSPAVLRTGANEASIDVDGDGTGDVKLPLTGKIAPVELTLGSGDAQRKWAFLAVIGQERDTYQGFAYNLGPNDTLMNVYIAPAASLVATVDAVRVQVLDDNMDGRYGSPPRDWGFPGLLEGTYQRDLDSVVIGEGKQAQPFSRFLKVGATWYQFEPDESGADLIVSKVDVETGTLQLDLKGLPVTWLVVRGTGQNDGLFYEVVNGGTKKVEVPVGGYELFAGQVSSGKKAQMMKCLIVPGKAARAWTVKPGETTKVELGAPFTLDFKVQQDAESVSVVGPSIVVVGRGGETYQRLWNCVLTPEVHARKAGAKKGNKEGKLVPVGSQEELETHQYDMQKAWFPFGEPIQKAIPGETYELQLTEKKHKLFGALESEWRAD